MPGCVRLDFRVLDNNGVPPSRKLLQTASGLWQSLCWSRAWHQLSLRIIIVCAPSSSCQAAYSVASSGENSVPSLCEG